ncbi:MAG: substrate-binding domain-containing protein [Proteobacteria bacterium]|nr:substrate-binding domain-containing protein [Pseudomonadota bacterium]
MNMKHSFKTIILSLFVFGLISPLWAMAEDVIVIANKSVPQSSLDADIVKKIYVGDISIWPDNTTVVVTIMDKSDFHEDFLTKYVSKSKSQFKATWKNIMFSGKGPYPKQFDNVDDLIKFVTNTTGAIGYVNASASPADVIVLK